ncbi:hypothetical protein CEXT_290121 [Caerostris extrusa]|uniref:Uncharacterized protein n=1 Tax=Caerostris extrusa TaxID=172846 RepID=A0AAV4T7V8_CAEEX|nr:hypothetical protein CEXT_290121 [Caerostris extrusa]
MSEIARKLNLVLPSELSPPSCIDCSLLRAFLRLLPLRELNRTRDRSGAKLNFFFTFFQKLLRHALSAAFESIFTFLPVKSIYQQKSERSSAKTTWVCLCNRLFPHALFAAY